MKATNWVLTHLTRGQPVMSHVGYTMEDGGTIQVTLSRSDLYKLRVSMTADEARQIASELNAAAALAHLGKL